MKWYSSDIKPEEGRWVIYCYQEPEAILKLTFCICMGNDLHNSYHTCWAYINVEEFLNIPTQKTTLPEYTGKRLISI